MLIELTIVFCNIMYFHFYSDSIWIYLLLVENHHHITEITEIPTIPYLQAIGNQR